MPIPRLFLAALLLTTAAHSALADPAPAATPKPAMSCPGGSAGSTMACCESTPAPADSHWHVRAELLAVSMPLEKAAGVLPGLLDSAKGDDAMKQIFELLTNRDATLAAYVVAPTVELQPVRSETVLEKVYPTTAANPSEPSGQAGLEKRNVGLTFGLGAPNVLDGGRTVDAVYTIEDVHDLGTAAGEAETSSSGANPKMELPRFFVARSMGRALFDNGKWLVLGTHKLAEAEDSIEIFVGRVDVTPRVP